MEDSLDPFNQTLNANSEACQTFQNQTLEALA